MTTTIETIAARVKSEVPALNDRVEYVAELAALVSSGALPSHSVCAYVVPLGLDDQGGDSATGMYIQSVQESFGVVICIQARGDAKSQKAVPAIDVLSEAVIEALAGWSPDNGPGVLRVMRGRMVSVLAGLVIYQIDFALMTQLRIER